jgi:hypothetical protein
MTYQDVIGRPKRPRLKPPVRRRPQRRRTVIGLRERQPQLPAPQAGSPGQEDLVHGDKPAPIQDVVVPGSQG